MFPSSLTSPSLLAYLSLALMAVVFFVRYASTPLTRALARTVERTVESRVSERVRELETAREHQSRVLTELSHNLQTPLSILKGKIERFERTLLHEGQPDTLCQSIDSISHVINEVLALSSLERSIREEERYPFSLSALALDAIEDVSVLAAAENIVLDQDIEESISLFGNERRLSDALMNLLGNAIKYMGNRPVRRIKVSLKRRAGQVELQVADTGMGIPKDELPYIFERFYRGSARAYGSIPGTGLGLAFVERIVKEHSGSITVTSEIDGGSVFTLILPSPEQEVKRGLKEARLRTSPA